jgi:hypothetical protein
MALNWRAALLRGARLQLEEVKPLAPFLAERVILSVVFKPNFPPKNSKNLLTDCFESKVWEMVSFFRTYVICCIG